MPCAVCGVTTELHSDLVLCCDGDQCENEVHMWCLNPLLSKVSSENGIARHVRVKTLTNKWAHLRST